MNATATIAAPTNGPQHMRALERANKVRLARAELKRGIAIGAIEVTDVISGCPWEAESMADGDLLMSQRRWGQTRCRKFLAQISMSEKKTIGSMTERQRETLIALLRGRTWRAGESDRAGAQPDACAQPETGARPETGAQPDGRAQPDARAQPERSARSGAGVQPRARAAATSS
jgi:hypothetical protein